MPRYRISYIFHQETEMDIVAASSFEAKDYALRGCNKSNVEAKPPVIKVELLKCLDDKH